MYEQLLSSFYKELREICSLETRKTQCGVGACLSQYFSGSLFSSPESGA